MVGNGRQFLDLSLLNPIEEVYGINMRRTFRVILHIFKVQPLGVV